MALFHESTQRARWQFTADQLLAARQEGREKSAAALQEASTRAPEAGSAAPGEDQGAGPLPAAITLQEELLLLKFYEHKVQQMCRELRFPRKVQGTALTYLKRFYLRAGALDYDPQQLVLTFLYLACKIEESYISAAELGRLCGLPAETVLRTELAVLQGLAFDFITYSPYKSVDAFFEDLRQASSSAATAAPVGLDPGLQGLTAEQLQQAHASAYAAVDALMLTDAPLLHTPGQLALAATRSAFNKLGVKLQQYLQRVVAAAEGQGGEGSVGGKEQLAQLQRVLQDLDRLGAEGACPVDQTQSADIDRRLKLCRGLLSEAGSEQTKQSVMQKSKVREDKAARKAAKLAAQRAAAEADVGILPDAVQPAAKRPRAS